MIIVIVIAHGARDKLHKKVIRPVHRLQCTVIVPHILTVAFSRNATNSEANLGLLKC
jgi:hypothetical protein